MDPGLSYQSYPSSQPAGLNLETRLFLLRRAIALRDREVFVCSLSSRTIALRHVHGATDVQNCLGSERKFRRAEALLAQPRDSSGTARLDEPGPAMKKSAASFSRYPPRAQVLQAVHRAEVYKGQFKPSQLFEYYLAPCPRPEDEASGHSKASLRRARPNRFLHRFNRARPEIQLPWPKLVGVHKLVVGVLLSMSSSCVARCAVQLMRAEPRPPVLRSSRSHMYLLGCCCQSYTTMVAHDHHSLLQNPLPSEV